MASSQAIDSAAAAVQKASLPGDLVLAQTDATTAPTELAAPSLEAPADPYTNVPTVTLTGTVPAGLAPGSAVVRFYRQATPPVLVGSVPVGRLPEFSLPNVALVTGANLFTATIAGSSGASASSAPIRFVYTTTKPKIVILSPSHGLAIATPTVLVSGRVPAGASVVVRNLTNNTGLAATADTAGSFSVAITLDIGTNSLLVSVTDRAGNANSASLSVERAGAGHRQPKPSAATR